MRPPPSYEPADTVMLIDVIHYLTLEEQDALLANEPHARCGRSGRLVVREADTERGWRSWVTLAEEKFFTLLRFNRGARVQFRAASSIVKVLEGAGLVCEVQPAWGGTPFSNVLIIGRREAFARPPMLSHEVVLGERATQLLFVLHGVFGSRANWRTFCSPSDRGCAGVGAGALRLAGARRTRRQPAAQPGCDGQDLEAMEDNFALPVVGVVGHSLGGKVALTYAAHRRDRLQQVWVLDAQPGAATPGGPAMEVLTILEELPSTFARRADFIERVVAHGQDEAVAAWLGMHLAQRDGKLVMDVDLLAIRQILDDYFGTDLWGELEREDAARNLHVVVGTASYVWTPDTLARLDALEAANVHRLEGAGHWVHVDALDELVDRMAASLRG